MSSPTEVVIPYAPRTFQRDVHQHMSRARFGVLVCHRRFGKTVLGVNHLVRGALTSPKTRPRLAYIGPTYRQSKQVAWDYLQHYSRPVPGQAANQSELRVDFPNAGQVRLYGSDNPDALRGIYLDGAVMDEFGMHPSKTFSEVIAPTLVDRGGWALFCGTPNGKNQFYAIAQHARAREAAGDPDWFFAEYKASDTGLLDAGYLASARSIMTADEYAQEFECSFEAAVKGAIYSRELEEVRSAGRMTAVSYDPSMPVDTDWDLGVADHTAIWFSQSTRSGEVRLIDYYEASGEGFPHYAQVLAQKGYVYGTHWAPHDIQVRELSSGRTRQEVAASLGITFAITPRLHRAVAGEVEEGIHAARMLLPRCWFDLTKTAKGVEALMHYRRDYSQKLNEFKSAPVHDWASHGADAFRGLAVRHQIPAEAKQRRQSRSVPSFAGDGGWMAY
jgi:phage terminase large subunit